MVARIYRVIARLAPTLMVSSRGLRPSSPTPATLKQVFIGLASFFVHSRQLWLPWTRTKWVVRGVKGVRGVQSSIALRGGARGIKVE